MFDVGFSELVVVGVVALIVIGPERLPGVARTAGVLLGRLQRYVNSVKADINREIQLDELKKLQDQVAEQARSIETGINAEMQAVETSLNELEHPASPEAAPEAAPAAEAITLAAPEAAAGAEAATVAPSDAQQPALEPPPSLQLELGLDHEQQRKGQA